MSTCREILNCQFSALEIRNTVRDTNVYYVVYTLLSSRSPEMRDD